jgi:uncharacterized membrane protein
MKIFLQTIPWLIILLSFFIPAYFYDSLPNEILIARSFFGNEAVIAPKSLFTVFRVALIEAVCAAVVEIMRRKSGEDTNYFSMWSILLYAVAFKSLFQSLELVSTEFFAKIFFYATAFVVVAGITAAMLKSRKFFANLFRRNLNLSYTEKSLLAAFLIIYLLLAFVPIFVFRQ